MRTMSTTKRWPPIQEQLIHHLSLSFSLLSRSSIQQSIYSRVLPSKPNQIEVFTVDILCGPNANNSKWYFQVYCSSFEIAGCSIFSLLNISVCWKLNQLKGNFLVALSLCNEIANILWWEDREINKRTKKHI